MKLEETLAEYSKTVQSWKETPFDDLMQNAELMKDMAIILSDLTSHRVKFRKLWIKKVFELKDEMSVSASEKEADNEYPELYLLRQIINAGSNILDSMRSQCSLLKKEL